MSRYVVAVCALLATAVLAHGSTYVAYEDNFDGSSLDPAWTVWGDGTYAVSGGTLNFVTREGDFHPAYKPTYGVPHHVFLITPPAAATQWSAVTRVRYNTPDERYEQVDLLAFKDPNNSVKMDYQQGSSRQEHSVLSEVDNTAFETVVGTSTYSDFFWMRLDRNGSTYTGWFSSDATTDPDLVEWSLAASQTNPMVAPQIGVAGWNTFTADSGELAEFDYFRLTVVPEPGTAALALCGLVVMLRQRGR